MSKELSQEVIDIFEDKDLRLHYVLRELATQFGADATLHTIAKSFYDYSLPVKVINGKTYTAGYDGPKMLKEGAHLAVLLDVKPQAKLCKLLFAVGGQYVYQNIENPTPQFLVAVTKDIGRKYDVTVQHEFIENTGNNHAVVTQSIIT